MVSVITEWQAPDCKKPGEFLLYFIPIAFAIICFIGNRKRIRLIDFVYFGFFVFLFLRSVRFILLWYIFMLFGGLKYIPVLKVKRITHPIEYITTACATLGALAFLCYGLVGSVNTIVLSPEPIRSEVSSQMIQYIKSEDVSIRLFNDYDYGGELIFNDIPVFFDSRADLFASHSIMKDGLEMLFLAPVENDDTVDISALLQKYSIDRIFVKKNRALYSYLCSNKQNFIVKFSDDNSAYFEYIK